MKTPKERNNLELLELVLELHLRNWLRPSNKEILDAYMDARKELENRFEIKHIDNQCNASTLPDFETVEMFVWDYYTTHNGISEVTDVNAYHDCMGFLALNFNYIQGRKPSEISPVNVCRNYSNNNVKLFKVIHRQFVTDHYEFGDTIVSANSKQEAMDKLNNYLSTKPHDIYTAEPCQDIGDVYELQILK